MSREKRQHQRFSVVDLKLHDQENGHLVGKVVNISEGGLLIEAYENYKKGMILTLRIPFNQILNGKVFYDFRAIVAWELPNATDNLSVGLELLDDSELQYQFLQNMIAVYGIPTE